MPTSGEEPIVRVRLSAREKAGATDQMAREIISAETNQRVIKTLRLRELRQEKQDQANMLPGVRG